MKTTLISFSPRKNGSCSDIMNVLCRLLENDGEIKAFDFSELTVTPCGGCKYECFDKAVSCPYISDSVYTVYESVTESDSAYFIVPNYCDYPCSVFFAFNERSQCFFQKKREKLEKYLSVPKKFIVVSNTGRDNFISAFRYQIAEDKEPDILFLSAKSFGKVSIRGDLMESEQAAEEVKKFALN